MSIARRAFVTVGILMFCNATVRADEVAGANLAVVAAASASFVSPHERVAAIQDDLVPRNSLDHSQGCYGNYPQRGTQWVQYTWDRPVSIGGTAVYWWDDHRGVRLPTAARLSYWDGDKFAPVRDVAVGVEGDRFNEVRFAEVRTTQLRLEFDAQSEFSTGLIEWRVLDSGASPALPPIAFAGDDRVNVPPAVTTLHGTGRGVARPGDASTGAWAKASGPGEVIFDNAHSSDTTASFTTPGDYTLKFTYGLRGLTADDTITVRVQSNPSAPRLREVFPASYTIDSAFWKPRLKAQIVNWIPHCIAKLDDVNLPEGGIGNLIEAGKRLRGEPSQPQKSRPWANAYIFNVVEAMSIALTYDAQGDAEILAAQAAFRSKLEEWIPLILAAQEPDGYFQTRFTLGTPAERERGEVPQRWNTKTAGEHEGYIAGYFIEAGIAHFIATQGKDRRLYDAARKLADCWDANIGPAPKLPWVDGHEELEQAMIRLGRFVNETEGAGAGQRYIALGTFLLDCRGHSGQPTASPTGAHADFYAGAGASAEYNQNHLPLTRQYTAVGHAVRAAYIYSALADVAAVTKDPAYWSAALSIWENIVDRKLYVTGGIGSGETSEGFGPDFSLPNASAYVESCSSCGLLFMQHKLNLATHDAKFVDLYETTLYNAILGDCDLPGNNFTYTNALDSSAARYAWHGCPCCVGNIPRVLLMLPTWMYARSEAGVYVNLFAGSAVDIGEVAGTRVQMVQTTDYPWKGSVAITVNPQASARFSVYIRSPKRQVSALYTATPAGDGITSVTVNGVATDSRSLVNGYVAIEREWTAGDTIQIELPLPIQTIAADERVAANRGRVALARGPLIYNIESVDGDVNKPLGGSPNLSADWAPELLGGVVRLRGSFADGTPVQAIPNYARLNRGGRSVVWITR